jgi:hypothetical protein
MSYTYKRTASRFLELDKLEEALSALELLQRQAQYAKAPSEARDLAQAIALVKKTQPFFEQQSQGLEGAAQELIEKISEALKHTDRKVVHSWIEYPKIMLSYSVWDMPRNPPDDDGPGDAAFWKQVFNEQKEALAVVKKVTDHAHNVADVDVRRSDKNMFSVEIKMAG